jgi:superfamily I DNA/RNA helicase
MELIKEIQNQTNSKLIVVGDDFQSIYSFTGSNLELITNFKKSKKRNKYPIIIIYYIDKT